MTRNNADFLGATGRNYLAEGVTNLQTNNRISDTDTNPHAKAQLDAVSSAIESSPTIPVTLYRATTTHPLDEAGMSRDNSPGISFTEDLEVAREHNRKLLGNKGKIYTIPAGNVKGISVNTARGNYAWPNERAWEKEWLVHPPSIQNVTEVK